MPSEAYLEARKKIAAAKKEAQELAKEAFEGEAKTILQELAIDSFSWTQYTPYFNDGDACVFGVNADYPNINGEDEDEMYDKAPKYGTPEYETWRAPYKRVADFVTSWEEEDLLFMFGDHVEVTVTKDGIEAEEFDHD